jgi:hypothetical protein
LRQTQKLAKLINDNQDLFTESERWHMAALGVVSSLAGVTGKVITGATGELVLWQGC